MVADISAFRPSNYCKFTCCKLDSRDGEEFDFFPVLFMFYLFYIVCLCLLITVITPYTWSVEWTQWNQWTGLDTSVMHDRDIVDYILIYSVAFLSLMESLFAFYRYYTSFMSTHSYTTDISCKGVFGWYSIYASVFIVLFAINIHIYHWSFPALILLSFSFNFYCTWKFASMLIERYKMFISMDSSRISFSNEMNNDMLKSVYFMRRSSTTCCVLQTFYFSVFIVINTTDVMSALPLFWSVSCFIFTMNFVRNRHFLTNHLLRCKNAKKNNIWLKMYCKCCFKCKISNTNDKNDKLTTNPSAQTGKISKEYGIGLPSISPKTPYSPNPPNNKDNTPEKVQMTEKQRKQKMQMNERIFKEAMDMNNDSDDATLGVPSINGYAKSDRTYSRKKKANTDDSRNSAMVRGNTNRDNTIKEYTNNNRMNLKDRTVNKWTPTPISVTINNHTKPSPYSASNTPQTSKNRGGKALALLGITPTVNASNANSTRNTPMSVSGTATNTNVNTNNNNTHNNLAFANYLNKHGFAGYNNKQTHIWNMKKTNSVDRDNKRVFVTMKTNANRKSHSSSLHSQIFAKSDGNTSPRTSAEYIQHNQQKSKSTEMEMDMHTPLTMSMEVHDTAQNLIEISLNASKTAPNTAHNNSNTSTAASPFQTHINRILKKSSNKNGIVSTKSAPHLPGMSLSDKLSNLSNRSNKSDRDGVKFSPIPVAVTSDAAAVNAFSIANPNNAFSESDDDLDEMNMIYLEDMERVATFDVNEMDIPFYDDLDLNIPQNHSQNQSVDSNGQAAQHRVRFGPDVQDHYRNEFRNNANSNKNLGVDGGGRYQHKPHNSRLDMTDSAPVTPHVHIGINEELPDMLRGLEVFAKLGICSRKSINSMKQLRRYNNDLGLQTDKFTQIVYGNGAQTMQHAQTMHNNSNNSGLPSLPPATFMGKQKKRAFDPFEADGGGGGGGNGKGNTSKAFAKALSTSDHGKDTTTVFGRSLTAPSSDGRSSMFGFAAWKAKFF